MSDPATGAGNGLREHVLLFSRFLRNPRAVGALTASSRALARAMVSDIDLARPGHIVELGPGTGVITAEIVKRLGPETRLLALDVDPEFVARVSECWPSVQCVCGSAAELDTIASEHDMLPLDHVISGLPFFSLPPAVTDQIIEAIVATLRPGGTFRTFQYTTGYPFPSAAAFRRKMTARVGSEAAVRFITRNMPPVVRLVWRKAEDR